MDSPRNVDAIWYTDMIIFDDSAGQDEGQNKEVMIFDSFAPMKVSFILLVCSENWANEAEKMAMLPGCQ